MDSTQDQGKTRGDVAKVDDGGPAFPAADAAVADFGNAGAYPGMSLRDYFAGQALMGGVASFLGEHGLLPDLRDSDFEPTDKPDEYGFFWCKVRGEWRGYSEADKPRGEKSGRTFRMVTTPAKRMARDAYELADAMLAARKAVAP